MLWVGKKEDTPVLPNVPSCFLSQRNQILCWSGIACQSWVLPVGVQPASAPTSTAEGPGLQKQWVRCFHGHLSPSSVLHMVGTHKGGALSISDQITPSLQDSGRLPQLWSSQAPLVHSQVHLSLSFRSVQRLCG